MGATIKVQVLVDGKKQTITVPVGTTINGKKLTNLMKLDAETARVLLAAQSTVRNDGGLTKQDFKSRSKLENNINSAFEAAGSKLRISKDVTNFEGNQDGLVIYSGAGTHAEITLSPKGDPIWIDDKKAKAINIFIPEQK